MNGRLFKGEMAFIVRVSQALKGSLDQILARLHLHLSASSPLHASTDIEPTETHTLLDTASVVHLRPFKHPAYSLSNTDSHSRIISYSNPFTLTNDTGYLPMT